MPGSTQAYLGTAPCTIVPYYSSDTKLTCYTPPAAAAGTVTVFVQLVYTGVSGSSYASCVGGPCTYTYSAAATPAIAFASLGGSPGATLRFYGALLGPTTQWYRIRVGSREAGLACDVSPTVQEPGIPPPPLASSRLSSLGKAL